MLNLINLFKQLKLPSSVGSKNQPRFSALPIPGYSNHRLAKDINGYPSLLISTKESPAINRPAPIKLEHLEVIYDIECRISHKETLENSKFTVISCTDQDIFLQEYFLRIGNAVIAVIGDSPSHRQVAKAVGDLVELFRVMNEAPRKSVQGLWAELLLISLATGPISLIRAWHRNPSDKFDFGSGNQRVEIKSATSRLREHHFSLDQLKPPSSVDVLIASVFVERVGTGTSLAELAESVRLKISKEPELLLYLDQVMGNTLGNDWRSVAKDKFDLKLAKKSLMFFLPENIPCIDSDLPKGVSDVHFKVDLSGSQSIDKKSEKLKDGIFKAAFPR